jgi:type II secretory pathway component PulF
MNRSLAALAAEPSGSQPWESVPSAAPAARQQGARRGLARRGASAASQKAVAEITSQLAIMVRSGLDLATALDSLARQCERPDLAETLAEVHRCLISGSPLSESLALHPQFFDGGYVATVAAAEASGRMSEVLDRLAHLQRDRVRLTRTIRGLLAYPIALVGISLTVTIVLVAFVLPKFADIFAQYEMDLPASTQVLLAVSGELSGRWWLWLPGSAVCGLGLAWGLRTARGRRIVDTVVATWGPFRPTAAALYAGTFCRLLGMLLRSGVPILDALRLTRESLGNWRFRQLVTDLADSVLNGRGMAPVLESQELFPDAARHMLATAERSGRLGEVAEMLGEFYAEEAEARLRSVVRLLEPAITIVMGAVIAFLVISVMLPVFDISSSAGGN